MAKPPRFPFDPLLPTRFRTLGRGLEDLAARHSPRRRRRLLPKTTRRSTSAISSGVLDFSPVPAAPILGIQLSRLISVLKHQKKAQ
ncbi:hypothetical protein VPH35_023676 [Triticum aestivum]